MKYPKVIPLYSYLKPLYQYLADTFCTDAHFSWNQMKIQNGIIIVPIQFHTDGELYTGELWKEFGLIGFNMRSSTGHYYSAEVEVAVLRDYNG